MKKFNLLFLCCCVFFSFISCDKASKTKENAEKSFRAILNETLKDPNSLNIKNITHIFTSDSLAIIHADITAKNGLGIESTAKYEYIYIDMDTINYEGIHSKAADSIYLTKEVYDETKKDMIYESLPYESGIYYLAASYINSYGRVVGDKANKHEVNITLPTKTGFWALNHNVDEFGEKTNNKYLTLVGRGVFSNSATTNSNMFAILFITRTNYLIRLIEYSSHVVKDECSGTFKLKDSDGVIHSGRFSNSEDGYLSYNSFSNELNYINFIEILKKGGDLIFSGNMGEYTTSNYIFKFKTDGFENAYNFLFSEEELNLLSKEKTYINNLKKTDPAIKTTETGLSYKIINEGNGQKATDSDFVTIKYQGKLIDGTIFDDSKGSSKEFPVRGVIPGFSEGLKLLGKGGKAILFIPSELGYGAQGQPYAGIGPNKTLIFEVEIIDIK